MLPLVPQCSPSLADSRLGATIRVRRAMLQQLLQAVPSALASNSFVSTAFFQTSPEISGITSSASASSLDSSKPSGMVRETLSASKFLSVRGCETCLDAEIRQHFLHILISSGVPEALSAPPPVRSAIHSLPMKFVLPVSGPPMRTTLRALKRFLPRVSAEHCASRKPLPAHRARNRPP